METTEEGEAMLPQSEQTSEAGTETANEVMGLYPIAAFRLEFCFAFFNGEVGIGVKFGETICALPVETAFGQALVLEAYATVCNELLRQGYDEAAIRALNASGELDSMLSNAVALVRAGRTFAKPVPISEVPPHPRPGFVN